MIEIKLKKTFQLEQFGNFAVYLKRYFDDQGIFDFLKVSYKNFDHILYCPQCKGPNITGKEVLDFELAKRPEDRVFRDLPHEDYQDLVKAVDFANYYKSYYHNPRFFAAGGRALFEEEILLFLGFESGYKAEIRKYVEELSNHKLQTKLICKKRRKIVNGAKSRITFYPAGKSYFNSSLEHFNNEVFAYLEILYTKNSLKAGVIAYIDENGEETVLYCWIKEENFAYLLTKLQADLSSTFRD